MKQMLQSIKQDLLGDMIALCAGLAFAHLLQL